MKKRILLITTMIMLFAFVLSISVLADAYDPNRTTIEYNGQSVDVITSDATVEEVAKKLGNNATMQGAFKDDNALVVLADANGSLFAFPTWYIIEPSGTDTNYVAISEVEYAFVNTLVEGSTFAKGAIRYIEFPHGMTHIRQNGVFGNSKGEGYEKNVTDVHIPNSVEDFQSNYNSNPAFCGNKSLKRVYIELGNKIKQIPTSTFSNSSVEYVQFENLTELESIDGFSNTGLNCDIDLSNSKLKTIAGSAFQNSTGIKKITLPDTVVSIGDGAFENIGSGYLASPYLPSSLTYVGKRFFAYNNNLLDTYIFPAGVKALTDEPFQDSIIAGGPSGKKLDLVFLGEVTGVVYVNGGGHQKHAEKVTVYFAQNSLDQYNRNGFYVKPSSSSETSVPNAIRVAFCKGTGAGSNGSVTGIEYIYLTNTSGSSYTNDMVNDATNGFDFENHTHYGIFTRVENTCASNGSETIACIVCDKNIVTTLEATGEHDYVEGICTVCGSALCPGGSTHALELDMVYPNGFTSSGAIANKCQNNGCDYYEKIDDAPALFTCLGYSVGPDGYSLKSGFRIDKDALNEYKSFNPDFKFGLVILNAKSVASDENLFVNGALNSSAKGLQVEIPSVEYTILNADVSNFNANMANSLELVVGLYTNDGEGNMTVAQYVNTQAYPTTKAYSDMSLNAITFNQVRVGHGMDALVPTTTGDEK